MLSELFSLCSALATSFFFGHQFQGYQSFAAKIMAEIGKNDKQLKNNNFNSESKVKFTSHFIFVCFELSNHFSKRFKQQWQSVPINEPKTVVTASDKRQVKKPVLKR